ncbi:MAG: hypothetical protein IJ461_00825, partial [Clostridia bacterium]|nr:hypothetical protein [Clostridia bacterium]
MRKRIAAMLLAILLLWAQPAFAHAEDAAALDDEAVDLCIQEGRYGDAITLLMSSDSEKVAAYYFKIAEKYLDENKMAELVALFKRASQSPNAAEDFLEPLYQKAVLFAASGNLLSASQPHLKAFQLFTLLGDYKDSAEKAAAAYKVIHAAPATATPTASPAAPKAS